MSEHNPDYQVVTFSFRGVEQKKKVVLRNQVEDLKEVIDFLISDGHKDITILCTSMGAFSTCFALTDDDCKNYITKAIFLDPADYELSTIDAEEQHTLSGADKYAFTSAIASSLLAKVSGGVIIDVAHLTIHNYGPDGYAEPENRGNDNPQLKPRLNTRMVKAFYERTPSKNRGQYIEIADIPHAFVRDGNIEQNVSKLTLSLTQLLWGQQQKQSNTTSSPNRALLC